jgi:phospholipid/cholesterol/gamma-HCH transport system permease protein
MRKFFAFIGEVSCFGLKALWDAFRPPFEWEFFTHEIEEIGWRSLPLVSAAGLALGIVLSLHTRSTLVRFGAEAMIPTLQSASFFNELGRWLPDCWWRVGWALVSAPASPTCA